MTQSSMNILKKLKTAYETADADLMDSLHEDGFKHTEMDDVTPPSNPSVKDKDYIVGIIKRTKESGVRFTIENMVDGGDKIAFTATCHLPNGREVVANIIADVKGGKLTRQLAVEARDPER